LLASLRWTTSLSATQIHTGVSLVLVITQDWVHWALYMRDTVSQIFRNHHFSSNSCFILLILLLKIIISLVIYLLLSSYWISSIWLTLLDQASEIDIYNIYSVESKSCFFKKSWKQILCKEVFADFVENEGTLLDR
jgi:hypothetical protein